MAKGNLVRQINRSVSHVLEDSLLLRFKYSPNGLIDPIHHSELGDIQRAYS